MHTGLMYPVNRLFSPECRSVQCQQQQHSRKPGAYCRHACCVGCSVLLPLATRGGAQTAPSHGCSRNHAHRIDASGKRADQSERQLQGMQQGKKSGQQDAVPTIAALLQAHDQPDTAAVELSLTQARDVLGKNCMHAYNLLRM